MKTTEMIQNALFSKEMIKFIHDREIYGFEGICACELALITLIRTEVKQEFRREVCLRMAKRFLDHSNQWRKEEKDERSNDQVENLA